MNVFHVNRSNNWSQAIFHLTTRCHRTFTNCRLSHPLPPPNGPEIVGEIPVRQIRVRHGEVPLLPPPGPPRVADDDPFHRVVVPHRQHRVTAQHPLTCARHLH